MSYPVFLISFNRGRVLEKSIQGLRCLDVNFDIIVHDNGSDDPETLDVLDKLEMENVIVVRRSKISSANELNNTNETVSDYFRFKEKSPYVVSDCDIDMSIADPNAINVYVELLNRFSDIDCVGPMLRIRDISPDYPLYARVMNRHVLQFWGRRPNWVEISTGLVAYQFAPIDTTFAVHRTGEPFRRLKSGIRVYEPFEARHLDWYVPPGVEDTYCLTSNSLISHWNNKSEFFDKRDIQHEYDRFFIVQRLNDGCLIEKEIKYRSF